MKNTKLRDAIFEQDLTQQMVANETGIPPAHLSMAINGKMFLNRPQRLKIAVLLGKPEAELFPVENHLEAIASELKLSTAV